MMGSTLRKQDELAADAVADFLDTNFYNKKTTNFTRVYDKDRQVVGVDTTFDFNGYSYVCDEKAAIRYANKNLQTYSLELSTKDRRGMVVDGWLLNPKYVNDSYLFVWLNKTKENIVTTADSIIEADISLVDKGSIMSELDRLGFDRQELKYICDDIRNGLHEYMGNIYEDGYKFVYSEQLYEQPITVLLPKKRLQEISNYSTTITV